MLLVSGQLSVVSGPLFSSAQFRDDDDVNEFTAEPLT